MSNLNKIIETESDSYCRKYKYEFELNGDLDNLSNELKATAYDMLLEDFEKDLKMQIFGKEKESGR